jgi:hypothetical protein
LQSAALAVLLLFLLCEPADAAGAGRWLRRITLAAACAASFWDAQTTRAAVARGARERNGVFADAHGRPQWGRMIGFKAGTCGSLAVAQELFFRDNEKAWTGLNIGLGSVYSGAAIHNMGVARKPVGAAAPVKASSTDRTP